MASGRTQGATPPSAARDRPDVFLSYAREDTDFVEGRLTRALVARGKDVWIDVEDIRGGASDWRATVWAGIESATAIDVRAHARLARVDGLRRGARARRWS